MYNGGMAVLKVLHFPDPRLRAVASPVPEVTDETRRIAADMLETMYDEFGIGLAAVQVNIPQRIIVIDLSEDGDAPMVLINPEVLEASGEEEMQEGCLSVPGYTAMIRRCEKIRVRARDLQGDLQEFEADGLLAVCIQHEIDHLDGKLFVDYLSPLKRERIADQLRIMEKRGQRAPKRSARPSHYGAA